MATSEVTVNFDNTTIGVASNSDGVFLFLAHAVEVVGSFELNKRYVLYQFSDLDALGITSSYDSTNGTTLYREIKDFYKEAGDGAILHLIGVDISPNSMSTYISSPEFKAIIEGLGKNISTSIKMMGVSFSPQLTPPVAPNLFYEDVIPTRDALMELYDSLKAQKVTFAAAIVDGNNMVNINDLPDQSNSASPQVGILITTKNQSSCASVGSLLGVYARRPVQYNIANGTLGVIKSDTMFFTNGLSVSSVSQTTFNALIGPKQYLFARTRTNSTGFFYNDDATCDLSTKSLANISNNRVRKKITDFLYEYLNSLIGTTPVQISGNIPKSTLAGYSASFIQSYIVQNNMLSVTDQIIGSEISGIDVVFSNQGKFSQTRTIVGTCNVLVSSGILNIVVDAKITNS